ncbi:hypothetical protein D3C74_325790 [compost metagenome]
MSEKGDVRKAYLKLEDWMYGTGKGKPVEVQAAMIWGGLMVAYNCGAFEWDEAIKIFGEFMSKKMNLR